jgi:predicted sugar kinase
MTPIDCNKFDLGRPGGGGLGFAIDTQNRLAIEQSRSTCVLDVGEKCAPIVLHYYKVMRRILSFSANYTFQLEKCPLVGQHSGLGSSVAVACAVVAGINRLYDSPLTIEEMRAIIAHNFVEEYEGKVARGLETGVGTSVILRGGFSVIGGEIVEVLRAELPEDFGVLLIVPEVARPESDKPESLEMLRRSVQMDASYRYTKSYNILMEIVPAFLARDYGRFGDHIWDIQFSGTHQSMIQSYELWGLPVYHLLCKLRSMEAVVVGMSSVGPTVYAWYPCRVLPTVFDKVKQALPGTDVHCVQFAHQGVRVVAV